MNLGVFLNQEYRTSVPGQGIKEAAWEKAQGKCQGVLLASVLCHSPQAWERGFCVTVES